MERSVAELQERAARSAAANVMLNQLTRERDTRAQIYQAFLARTAQTGLSSAQFSAARVISPARPSLRPDGPSLPIVAMFGAFAGLLGAGALVLGRNLLRDRIGSPQELAVITGTANVGSLPLSRQWGRRGMAVRILEGRNSGIAETLRGLQISLRNLSRKPDGATVVLVTSAERGDGKSTIAASLASVCALDGLRVLLLEGDLRRPRLALMFGAQRHDGLEAVLAGDRTFEESLYVEPQTGLHGLFASGNANSPQAMLQSKAFRELMSKARRDYELIIVDSPPILSVADPVLLAGYTDTVLFAVAWERLSGPQLSEALQRLPHGLHDQLVPVLKQGRRLLAVAEIYDGGRRRDAARIGGVGLQIVRDWVVRFNAEGPDGLRDRKAPGQPPKLTAVSIRIESRPPFRGEC